MPRISIVLPVYNGEKYLRESINSILNQTFSDWELICVNDCSTDSTPIILEDYAKRDSRIRIIHNAENQKLPKSLNIGFSKARGDFFTWTSDDNLYLPEALQIMHDKLLENRDCPMVVADMTFIDEQGGFLQNAAPYDKKNMYWNNCVGACFLYRWSVVEKIGGYDTSRFLVEDYDYWLRIQSHCGDILHIPQVLYRYRFHSQSLTATKIKEVQRKRMELLIEYFSEIESVIADSTEHIAKLYFEGWMNGLNMKAYLSPFVEYIPELAQITISRNVENLPEGATIALFGAGEFGKRALHRFRERVMAFIDNDDKKDGTKLEEVPVYSLKEYCKTPKATIIMISVDFSNVYGIVKQLYKAGVKKIRLFCEKC